MIICSGCGHANGTGDAFCGSCGAFLEWDGQTVQAPAASQPATTVPATTPLVPAPAAAPLPAQRAEPVIPGALLPEPQWSVRVPQAEHERPAPVRPDPVDLGPADLYCGRCGAGNADGRMFCRRCGASLEDALAAERLPWWRRWWRALRRRTSRRRDYAAGERPDGWAKLSDAAVGARSRKRAWWKPRMPARLSLGKAAMPIALLSLVGFGIAPIRAAVTQKAFGLYHQGRQVVAPRFVPVSASSATSTSAQGDHVAAMAIDQNTLTWWSEGRPGRGRGERLVVHFDRPVDLSRITVHDGAAEEQFPFQPRVRDLRVSLRGPDGVVAERRIRLADDRELQQFEVSGSGVTSVRFRILSTYAGQKGSAASIAEVGFFTKQ
jgi:hypothetical protein